VQLTCESRRFPITGVQIFTKSSNWIPVIGHPYDHSPITRQIGVRRTNQDQEFYFIDTINKSSIIYLRGVTKKVSDVF